MARGMLVSHEKFGAAFHKVAVHISRAFRDRSGIAAIEFAIEAPLFLLMVFGIINLSDLGYTAYALNKGVVDSARFASVEATNSYVAQAAYNTISYQCPTSSEVEAQFSNAAGPLINADSISAFGLTWGGKLGATCGSGVAFSSTPGEWTTVTVEYVWTPLILGSVLGAALHLHASFTDAIIDNFSQ